MIFNIHVVCALQDDFTHEMEKKTFIKFKSFTLAIQHIRTQRTAVVQRQHKKQKEKTLSNQIQSLVHSSD